MNTPQTIICDRRTYSSEGCTHVHTFAQLILPLTGSLFIQTPTHQLELDDSSIFFLPAACSHYFYARSTNDFLTLDIPKHLITPLPAHSETEKFSVINSVRLALDDRWVAIRTLLLAEVRDGRENQKSRTNALLPLVSYISSLLAQPCLPPSIQYIHDNYHTSITVTHLSKIEGYCLSYYSEWFKAKTGKTPTVYIQDLRIQQAKKLLHHTDLTIQAIAHQVGFERASSLARLFQQRKCITPQAYRTAIRNPANLSLESGCINSEHPS
ncbi:MAG: AraC family transcriptional regulator [Cyanobacteria bacterium J06576_12]